MCCTYWVKREGIRSEESGILDGIFEGSVIVHLVRKNIVVEYRIRDDFFRFVQCLVHFFLGVEKFHGLFSKDIVEFLTPGALFGEICTPLST